MTDERYSPEERKFWADAFLSLLSGSDQLLGEQSWLGDCAANADEALEVYREQFGIRPDEADGNYPDSSPPRRDFFGEPEPITPDVLQSLKLPRGNRIGNGPFTIGVAVSVPRSNIFSEIGLIADARKLRAIMEILQA